MKWNSLKPFKKLLTSNGGSTAGRNSAGRITIWHRGGGAKRLQRKVDLKRNTSAMGVVERIEYDPNRSARVALVRWIEGVQPDNHTRVSEKGFTSPSPKTTETNSSTVLGQFPLACLAGNLVVGGPPEKESGSKISSVRDVFLSALSSKQSKGDSLRNFPRMAVAGSKPAVFAPKIREPAEEGEKTFSLSDVRTWRKDSILWEHRLKPKAAVSWLSFIREEPVGLAAAAYNKESKSVRKSSRKGGGEVDRAPLTYIIASNGLKAGDMVMNVDTSIRSPHK